MGDTRVESAKDGEGREGGKYFACASYDCNEIFLPRLDEVEGVQ